MNILIKKLFAFDNILMCVFIILYFTNIYLFEISGYSIINNITSFYMVLFFIYINFKHLAGIVILIKDKQKIVIRDFLYLPLQIIVSAVYLINAMYGIEFIINNIEYLNENQKTNYMVIFDIIMAFGLIFSMIKYNRIINNKIIRIYYNIIVSCVYLMIFIMVN
jgi:hypothetical protein